MGGATINVLPRDSELARRAAGGDGTAFMRLYDRYAADVFEAVLEAGESVERAAHATQSAFLTLLRHPPAIDAPAAEVLERLRTMALAGPPDPRAGCEAGIGWLRSETVAKAGARFDADWSGHLAAGDVTRRTPAEVAFTWQSKPAPAPLPPPVRTQAAVRLRRFRPRATLRLAAAFVAAAVALVLLAASGENPQSAVRIDTVGAAPAARLAPLEAMGRRPRPDRAASGNGRRDRRAPARGARGTEERVVDGHPVFPAEPVAAPDARRAQTAPARAPAAAGRLGATQETVAPDKPDLVRADAPVLTPEPPSGPPAASPPPTDTPAPAPIPR